MNKILVTIKGIIILSIFLINFTGTKVFSQDTLCEITAEAAPVIICEGEAVILTSYGGCPTYLMDNDFDLGTVGTGWSSTNQAQFDNPCGPGLDGTPHLWMGETSEAPRILTTIAFDISGMCEICFDLKFATQSESSPCEGPDMQDEGVSLQWSIDGGITWNDITYFSPDGCQYPSNIWIGQPTTSVNEDCSSDFVVWNTYCFDIPPAAQTTSTMFRWGQLVSTSDIYDHWGIDNVQIFCPPPNQTVVWNDGTLDFDTTFNSSPQYPDTNTAYIVTVSDGTNSATDTVYIIVNPSPALSINGLDPDYCLSDPTVTLSGVAVPPGDVPPSFGIFSGPGITGDDFNPSAAGLGTHDITYTYYVVTEYITTGMQTFWEDDFSTDIGWTGYGSGGWQRALASASAGCSGSQDPSSDNTPTADNFIIGNYIGACYPNNMGGPYWLTSPVIDCSAMSNIQLVFWSHSGCESSSFDHMYIDVSNNGGATWPLQVYSNGGSFDESNWTERTYDISATADGSANVRIRFGMGGTDGSVTYKGWNIDDFTLIGDGDLLVSDTTCVTSIMQQVTVLNPPTSTFTATSPVCTNTFSNIVYTGTGSPSATYNWDFDGGTVIGGDPNNPALGFNVNWSTPDAIFNVSLTVTGVNGCTSDITTVPVTILPYEDPACCPMPFPYAGPDSSVCTLNYTLSADSLTPGNTGVWTYTGPGIANLTSPNSLVCYVTVDTYGSYDFIWTETYGPDCENSDIVTIAFNQIPTSDFTAEAIYCHADIITITYTGNATPLANYTWDFDGGTIISGSGQGPYMITWSTAGNYVISLQVTENGCTSDDITTITVTNPVELIVNITGTDVNCYGGIDGEANLSVNGGIPGYSYIWNNGSVSENLSIISAAVYCVTVTDVNSCTATACVTITEPATPLTIVDTYSINIECNGESTGLAEIFVTGGTGTLPYLWSNFATTSGIQNVEAGTYTVTVTDDNNCFITETFNLTEPYELVVLTSPDVTVCIGQSANITAQEMFGTGTPPCTFYWSNGFIGISGQPNNVTPVSDTVYSVYAIDANGCISSSQTVNVYANAPLNIILSTDNDTICPGEPAVIIADISGGDGEPYLITNLTDETVVAPPFKVYPNVTTSYIITLNDNCTALSASDTIIITVDPLPPLSFSSDIISGCQPLTVNFNESSPNVGQSFLWDFGDIYFNFSYAKNPEHIFENSGTYNISLTVTSNFGCINSYVYENMITVYPKPDASFIANPQTVSIVKPIVLFDNVSSYADTCYWSFGDGDSSSITYTGSIEHKYNTTGTYRVELIVASEHGCRDTTYTDIYVKDEYTFYIPSAFTPDNDELNETFIPVGKGIDPENFLMIIYDRWGEKVFVTHNLYQGWDGKIKGKKIGASEIYTWFVVYKDLQGVEHKKTGSVTLIR